MGDSKKYKDLENRVTSTVTIYKEVSPLLFENLGAVSKFSRATRIAHLATIGLLYEKNLGEQKNAESKTINEQEIVITEENKVDKQLRSDKNNFLKSIG